MADLCQLLGVKQLWTTVYHPQTDCLVERFNQTLKQMLRWLAAEDRRDWDLMLPYVLMSYVPVSREQSCLASEKYPRPPLVSPPSSFCLSDSPGASWMWPKSLGAAAGNSSISGRAHQGDEGKARPSHAVSLGAPDEGSTSPTKAL
ncbi:hypothetical protein QQF64_000343 [Cirrhinus molitorella]|uniref:Integrase catalytic domain-containing protein n=1 Tax=Cirrhinus molitorella TaxID=172907 RepID=A0ABR3NXD8_9TELE